MKRKQFSEEQIISILKEAEAGAVVTELCRRHGMTSATYYAWKAKFGGLEVSDAKRLRALEEENARLKRLLADTMLDNAGLKVLEHPALRNDPPQSSVGAWHFRRPVDGQIIARSETLMLSEKRKYPEREPVAGYRPKQKIVQFAGREGRAEEFHYVFVFPDSTDAAPRPATALQTAAFMRRVGFRLPEDAMMDQVSQVLSALDFATRVLHSRGALSAAARDALIRYAVGMISTDPGLRLDIRWRMRQHHEGSFDPLEPVAPYYRPPKHFTALRRFADAVVADMRAAGALSFG